MSALKALGWKQWSADIDLSGIGSEGKVSIGCWYWFSVPEALAIEGFEVTA